MTPAAAARGGAAAAHASSPAISIRPARLTDIAALQPFIARFTGDGTLLPRTKADLARHIRDFQVAVVDAAPDDGAEDGALIGCAALQLVDDGLAELRTVALDPAWRGRGFGHRLVAALLGDAQRLGLPRVFCLTRQVEFFARQGFIVVPKEIFPHKVWNDCRLCPRQAACDETAMELSLG